MKRNKNLKYVPMAEENAQLDSEQRYLLLKKSRCFVAAVTRHSVLWFQ
jgi:hypothetical protein